MHHVSTGSPLHRRCVEAAWANLVNGTNRLSQAADEAWGTLESLGEQAKVVVGHVRGWSAA